MSRNIKIGITAKSGSLIWSNGLVQNVHFLKKLLSTIDNFDVVLVSESEDDKELVGTKIDRLTIDLAKTLDLLLEVAYVANDPYVDAVRESGGKVVSIKYGNNLISDIESILYNSMDRSGISSPGRNDEMWISPHFEFSAGYLGLLSRTKVRTCPYIWDSEIFDSFVLKNKLDVNFSKNTDPKTIGVFEPNINVVKTSIIPISIIEGFYRKDKENLNNAYIFGSDKLKENKRFIDIMTKFDSVIDRKMSFEGRLITPFIFDKGYANTIVSHQWENELNYLYLEAMHTLRPLVHNSKPFKAYGYYYEHFDVDDGIRSLDSAVKTHRYQLSAQREIAEELLFKFNTFNPENIRSYKNLILDVLKLK